MKENKPDAIDVIAICILLAMPILVIVLGWILDVPRSIARGGLALLLLMIAGIASLIKSKGALAYLKERLILILIPFSLAWALIALLGIVVTITTPS